ncbi:MAG: DUF6498-containing protein [Hyphomonadaceae bacterium]
MSGRKVPIAAKALPLLTAIAINLVPVAGVLFWGWSAAALIVLYWLENLVIGVRTLASIGANAALSNEVRWPAALLLGAFFAVHYGLFCFGHGMFVIVLFAAASLGANMFDLAGAVSALFAQQPGLYGGLASIVIWQALQFVLFLTSGQAGRTTPFELMGAPYPRIIVLHMTILLGGFLLLALNQPAAGLLLLTLVKMGFDVEAALRSPSGAEPSRAEPGPIR